jgi:acyl-[acyl-carrier-protein] desaturase
MSVNDSFDITVRQLSTTPQSATAMLDTETERRLYNLYRQSFRESEETRNWNLWTDIPWDAVTTTPSPELVDAVFAAFREDLFLPDYSAKSLHILRASRGRAWFWTRWSYEEGKHLLTWIEWLTRSGAYADDYLRQYADDRLAAYRWEPPLGDAAGIFWDTLLWEERELNRVDHLLEWANTAGDTALSIALGLIRADEAAHFAFLKEALRIIGESYPERILTAAEKVATANEIADGTAALFRLIT